MAKSTEIYFLLSPDTHLLDLAGPCQAFHEAKNYGLDLTLHYIGAKRSLLSYQGLGLSGIAPLPVSIPEKAIIVVCASKYSDAIDCNDTVQWLKVVPRPCTKIVGICTGTFLLGSAGWLDGRSCTTHHQLTAQLAARFPEANVLHDRIYVHDGQVFTSAGVTAGIDLALQLIENLSSPAYAMDIARELVVNRRRMSNDPQLSKQISYRSHISPLVHSIQDYLQLHSDEKLLLNDIANIFRVSVRHMQREFKSATGITVRQYLVEIRLEDAKGFLEQGYTIESAAYKAGFPQAKALRSAWKKKHQSLPRQL
ncbi:GlxA family transcriptional regulator [Photobacterium rosenbergii]|uniref:Helix-turn-helix domain-containing protein n=1 Tax=Photobacterium rosenbergii TaxID=294936 RepID=A0ABU3ZI04_9GAMM|nr:helix-turn-helix domain-containing protein [Photobacterium rosenbergii]MDV5169705.1 helix-turn-helix domain-containing protein [Photobacterium rosenbergii]